MSKHDQLDTVLKSEMLSREDFDALAEAIGEEQSMPWDKEERRIFLNKKIRHAFGHMLVNPFRDWWEPDYRIIVEATAKKLNVHYEKSMSLEQIEENILLEILEIAKKTIIKEHGKEAWNEIVQQAEAEIRESIAKGQIKGDEALRLKALSSGSIFAALIAGKLAGFSLYIVVNQLVFAIARYLGIPLTVGLAGPILGKTLAILLGPVGWLLGGIFTLIQIGDTSWKKVIPGIVIVAIYRRKIKFSLESNLTVVP